MVFNKYLLKESKKGIDKRDISKLIDFSLDLRALHSQGESLFTHLSYMKSHIIDMMNRHRDYMKDGPSK